MRPGNQSNKRMRGRGRKGPNPLTRTYESNGPDVKIRGTAMHIAEKYQQLARDAQASGDRVMFENYNQHAEHYLRIVAAAQPQTQPPAQQSHRQDADDGGDAGYVNGAAAANGTEYAHQEASEKKPSAADLVDEDSPQPFIDDMPLIDQEGQINGSTKAGEAADEDEEKPRRRTRTPRSRSPRRTASEGDAAEAAGDTAKADKPEAAADEPPKPRRRTRARAAKPAEEGAEPVAASE